MLVPWTNLKVPAYHGFVGRMFRLSPKKWNLADRKVHKTRAEVLSFFILFETLRGGEEPSDSFPVPTLTSHISWLLWVLLPVFLDSILHTFAQAESGCGKSSSLRSEDPGSSRPSPDILMTSGHVAWQSCVRFFPPHLLNENRYSGSWLVQRHVVRPHEMKAFEVLRAKASCTWFRKSCRGRWGSGQPHL